MAAATRESFELPAVSEGSACVSTSASFAEAEIGVSVMATESVLASILFIFWAFFAFARAMAAATRSSLDVPEDWIGVS